MWKRIKNIFERPSNEPLFAQVQKEDTEMLGAYQSAAAALDQFVSFICDDRDLTRCVKLRLKDPALSEKLGEVRYVLLWLSNVRIEDNNAFVGVFFETPAELRTWYRPGEYLRFRREEIVDWFVNDQGRLYGGYTMRVQRAWLPENERASFDEYTGVREWVALKAN
jgi:uncharacterized protein YegJ (DUF2314 family)